MLLTTGSKDLDEFTKYEALKDRLRVRVMPGTESTNHCLSNGICSKKIIAMQGPFSLEMNLAQISMYKIDHMVTKISGKEGGEDTKIAAAKEAGIKCHIINRPDYDEEDDAVSVQSVIESIERLTKVSIDKGMIEVTLIAVG